jgi:MFS family permease
VATREQLDWEARWSKPAAIAAFGSIGFTVAAGIYVSSAIESTPDADNTRELLRLVDADGGVFVTGAALSGIGLLLLGAVLVYLYNAVKARRPELTSAALVLAILGSVLLAVAAIAVQLNLVDRASEFLASGAQTEKRADDLIGDRPALVQSLGLSGALAIAFATILISQTAMRVGLLTRFLGVLGIVVGALFVLGLLFPLGSDIIRLFWLIAVGLVILGKWPGGRGPAWESGEAEPWLTPAQKRALELGNEEPGTPAAEPSAANDDDAPARNPRKRKKKRR